MDAITDQHRTGTVKSGDVTLFYRVFGVPGGTPVLILHGANYFDSNDWLEIAADLGQDREVCALDWRGFGESEWSPSKDYSADAFLGDIASVLEVLGWRKPLLAGHSMGGKYTILYAARHSDELAGAVMIDHAPGHAPPRGDGPATGNPPTMFDTVDEAMQAFGHDTSSDKERKRAEKYLKPVDGRLMLKRDPDFSNTHPVGPDAPAPTITDPDMWAELKAITCPAMILRGTRSNRYSEAALARVRNEYGHIKLVELDSGHDMARDDPAGVIDAMREFLAEID